MNLYEKYMKLDKEKVTELGTVELTFTDSSRITLHDCFVVGEAIFGLTKAKTVRNGDYIAHKYIYHLQVTTIRSIHEEFDSAHWGCTPNSFLRDEDITHEIL